MANSPMTKYLEAEKRLAELLGWKDAEQGVGKPDRVVGVFPGEVELRGYVPAYTLDWSACGPLMVEHRILVHPMENEVEADRQPIEVEPIQAWYYDHPDRDTAVRFAIVQAVIKKLENEHG